MVHYPHFGNTVRRLLSPFPKFTMRLYRQTSEAGNRLEGPGSDSREAVGRKHRGVTETYTVERAVTVLDTFYRAAFNRSPDDSAVTAIERRTEAGISLDGLAEGIVSSPEFRGVHGSDTAITVEYISALYRNALGREPAAEEIDFWIAQGNAGATRAGVLQRIALSDEAACFREILRNPAEAARQEPIVTRLYCAGLGRLPGPEALSASVRQLFAGVGALSVAETITDTEEFRIRHGYDNRITIDFIRSVYRDGLNLPASTEIILFWLRRARLGLTRAELLVEIGRQGECRPQASQSVLDYPHWIEFYDDITQLDRDLIREHLASLPEKPLISIVISDSKKDTAAVGVSVASVLGQLYSRWQLILVSDGNHLAEPQGGAEQDLRIVSVDPPSNDLYATFSRCLEYVDGDYILLLPGGVSLCEHALYEIAIATIRSPKAEIYFCDHDEKDSSGRRTRPWFKPAWDPDLFLAQDYIGPVVVYRKEIITAAGGIGSCFPGAELYDLALRATHVAGPDKIIHLPKILYHIPERLDNSQELNLNILQANSTRRAVIQSFLTNNLRVNAKVSAVSSLPSANRIFWPIREESPPKVAFIIPTKDQPKLLQGCISSLLRITTYPNYEAWVVDNGTTDSEALEVLETISRDARVHVTRDDRPFNFSRIVNEAARKVSAEVLLLLNDDTQVIHDDWLYEMVSQVVRLDVGLVGAKLFYPDDTIQHAGMVLGPKVSVTHIQRFLPSHELGYKGQVALARSLSAVTGACAAIRRSVFFEVGGMNEDLAVGYNDVDLALRVQDYGYRVVWTPFAQLYHLESASRGPDNANAESLARSSRELALLRSRWGRLLDEDPYHNPNLLFAWDRLEVPSIPREKRSWDALLEAQVTSV
jgi:GT2 family glycosyltransferase